MTAPLTKAQAEDALKVYEDVVGFISDIDAEQTLEGLRAIASGHHAVHTAESIEAIKRVAADEALERAAALCLVGVRYTDLTWDDVQDSDNAGDVASMASDHTSIALATAIRALKGKP